MHTFHWCRPSCSEWCSTFPCKVANVSQVFIAKVGRSEEAIRTADIQADGNIHDPLVIAEWEDISTVLLAERDSQKGWRQFMYKGMWRRPLAGMSVQYV